MNPIGKSRALTHILPAAALGLLLAGTVRAVEISYDYLVPLTPENAIIGHYSATKKPVISVKSGSIVKINGGGGSGAVRGDNPDPVKWLNDNNVPINQETLTCLQETARVL